MVCLMSQVGGPGRSAQRLPKAERRAQLLDAAAAIVADEGTDALTLQAVAARAGVTKPIAYEHFGSREGALIALYRRLDDDQMAAARNVLANGPDTLEAVCQVVAASYIKCCVQMGPAYAAISAALEGSEEMQAVKADLRDSYVEGIHGALKPFVSLPPKKARLLITGFLGAADALGAEAAARKTTPKQAADLLGRIMCASLAA